MNTYYFTEGKFYKKVNIIKYQGDKLCILQDFSGNIILRKDCYILLAIDLIHWKIAYGVPYKLSLIEDLHYVNKKPLSKKKTLIYTVN